MSLRKLTDSIGVKASGVFIMALQSEAFSQDNFGSALTKYEQVRNPLSLDPVWYRGKDL